MDPDRWRAVAAVAERALELEGAARDELVAREAAARPELADDLARVLAALGGVDEFARGLARRIGGVLDADVLRAGDVVGVYQIERELGAGGMGAVYLARRSDAQYEKTVAIKVLTTPLSGAAARDRFLAERQLLATLEHPAIARLIDGGVTDDGRPYYVLEYADGVTADRFADGADLAGVLRVVGDICDAVAHAHARLVIHCDLKPANVLVSGDGRVKLLDFGVARSLEAAGHDGRRRPLADVRSPVTRNYAAPELLAGDEVDTRADVHSLGVLLYRLLSGEQAYRLPPGAPAAVRAAREAVAVPRLGRRGRVKRARGLVIAELDAIIARATAVDREARTGSVRELADEIDRVRRGQPLSRPPRVRGYRLRKAVRRNPAAAGLAITAAALAAAAFAILVGALVATRAEKQRAERISARLEEERQTAAVVSEFLTSVFDAADPELREPGAPMASARDLVESGLARIDAARPRNRTVAARLDLTLGQIARKIGEPSTAKLLLGRALEQGAPAEEARRARLELGIAQGDAGEAEAARATLALAADRCAAAGDEACVLEALRARGEMEFELGDLAAARRTLGEGLARVDGAGRDRGLRALRAQLTYGLAQVEHRAGHDDLATRLLRDAREQFERLGDGSSAAAAAAQVALGITANARGEYRDSLALLGRARRMLVDLYGPRHPRVAYVDFTLSHVHGELGDLDRALEAARRSLELRREILGDAHRVTGMTWGRLAHALFDAGRDREAASAAERSREVTREADPVSYANVGLLLARVQSRAGLLAPAVATARESLAIYQRRFGAEHAMTLRGHAAVTQALSAAGQQVAAIQSQERAVAIGEATLRPEHPRRSELRLALGELLLRAGRRQRAATALREAAELAASAEPPQPERAARARALLDQVAAKKR